MSVTSIDKDFDSLTLTMVADFDAPAERVWDLWALHHIWQTFCPSRWSASWRMAMTHSHRCMALSSLPNPLGG